MTKLQLVILSVLMGLAGYGIGHYIVPTNVVSSDKEKVNNDVTTVVKEHVNKDGTVDKQTTIVDKSKSQTNKTIEAVLKKPDWFVTVTYGINHDLDSVYGLLVNRRILGNVFVGGYLTTKKDLGLSVGYEF